MSEKFARGVNNLNPEEARNVRRPEEAALDQRNLQHAEVIRARIPDIAFILLALRDGALFHDKTDRVAVALQGQLGRHRNILDARQSPHFFGEAVLELKSARVRSRLRNTRLEPGR